MAGSSDRLHIGAVRLGAPVGSGSAATHARTTTATTFSKLPARSVSFQVSESLPARRLGVGSPSLLSKFARLAEPDADAEPPAAPRFKGLLGFVQRLKDKKAEKAADQRFATQLMGVLDIPEVRASKRFQRKFKNMSKDMVDVHGQKCTGAVIEMASGFLAGRVETPVSYFERDGASVQDRKAVLYQCITDPAPRRHLINIAAIHPSVTSDNAKSDLEGDLVAAALQSAKALYENEHLAVSVNLVKLIESTIGRVDRPFQYLTSQQRQQLVRDFLWQPEKINVLYPARQAVSSAAAVKNTAAATPSGSTSC
jgi:hypothetical protein